MHTLLVILIVLMSIFVILLGIIAFIMVSFYMTLQPIIQFLGKIGMGMWLSEIVQKIGRRFGRSRRDKR